MEKVGMMKLGSLITHSVRQMFLVVAGFVVVILLLEADGLASWANNLEIGPLRTAAIPVTAVVKKVFRPVGAAGVRERVLVSLAKVGWSDDPALLAEAAAPATASPDLPRGAAGLAGSKAVAAPGSVSGSVPSPAARNTFPHAAGSGAAVVSDVPRNISLAPLPAIEPGRPRVVALAGDSMMAVGLSATLMRLAAGDKNLRIVKAFRSGTGLARPEVFNWMDEYPAMVGDEKPDVVLVAIGANDGQGFVVDGKVLPYGSDGWRKVYQDRLASYLAMVSATGARVVWVGLPPMRSPVYDQKIAEINKIAYTVVSQQPQAEWWNPVSLIGDDAGRFREFETLPNGQTMRLRATDGIHFSDEGAGLLTSVLMKWLDPPPPAAAPAVATPVSSESQGKPAAKARKKVHKALAG